jgi:hypothetical protein
VADFRRLKPFRELVDLVEVEFAERGMPLKPGAAADLVAERAEMVADQLGITPRSALNYFAEDDIKGLARNTARQLKEHQAAQDARSPVSLSFSQAGMVISAFAVAARLSVLNGDPDVAADLCEVITSISICLRDGRPRGEISALLLDNGLNRARVSAENLASGAWSVEPGETDLDADQRIATALSEDIEAIEDLLR